MSRSILSILFILLTFFLASPCWAADISPGAFPGGSCGLGPGGVGSGNGGPGVIGEGGLGGGIDDGSGSIAISGDDSASVGDQYSASGGIGPYFWSISCGVIDDSGTVASLDGCCGSGLVSAVDDTGNEGRKVVRFPKGRWASEYSRIECFKGNCNTNPYTTERITRFEGGYKKESTVSMRCCLIEGEAGHTGTCPPVADNLYNLTGTSGKYCEGGYAPYGGSWFSYYGEWAVFWWVHIYYPWVCND